MQPPLNDDGVPSWMRNTLMYPLENCAVKVRPSLARHRPSCPLTHCTQATMSGVMGGAMGFVFGLVFSTSPSDLSHIPVPGPDGKYGPAPPFQWKKHFRDMGKGAVWYGRSFAVVGLLFAGSECVIEKARGKSDIWNGIAGGCAAGTPLCSF